jgi:predicted  nucleic acid-binding Zn-ribbon protein
LKEIKLKSIALRNFKGVNHFEFEPDGQDGLLLGDNGTGKTTIADGFIWLLFDKDSNNKKDFEIKTLQDGKPLHNLEHTVEATLLVDGKELTLKKVFKEKWTKKRGSVTEEFSGHTTLYEIDGVPAKKKEFTDQVASIVEEDIFKLLTNSNYFNEKIHWKDRRDLLLEISGDVTEDEVFATNKDLKKLADILNGRSIEDHKKVIAAKRKEINDELDRIPIRVDEIKRNFPDTNGLDKRQILSQLESIADDMDGKQSQINDIKSGGEVNKLRMQISDIDLKVSGVKNEHAEQGQQEIFKLKTRLQEEQSNAYHFKSKVDSHEQRKSMNFSNIKDMEQQMQDLREQWKEQSDQEFDHEANCACPTCEQELPEEQIEEAKANFNRNKSSLLEKINAKGVQLKEKVESIKQENASHNIEIEKLNQQIEGKQAEVEKLQNKINDAESNVKPIEENTSYQQLMKEKQGLENRITEIESSIESSVQGVQQEIAVLKESQGALQIDLSKLEQAEQSNTRITELEEQQKTLAAEFEKLEEELYLAEEFTRTKVNLLEEKINSKFQYARFKLFEEQINGGLTETCETLYQGVPYSSGLNNAARINVGLDIINTLSQHFGVQAPIFVDNAESVTKLLDIDSQIISLVVSENDQELRIETKEKAGVA